MTFADLSLLTHVCADVVSCGHALAGSTPLVHAVTIPVNSSVHNAAAALFAQLSAGGGPALDNASCQQRMQSSTPTASTLAPAAPALVPPVNASCTAAVRVTDSPGTDVSKAASALFSHMSSVEPAVVPSETSLKNEKP